MTGVPMLERLRLQKRHRVAQARRAVKIARHDVDKLVQRLRTRAAKRYERQARRTAHVAGLWSGKLVRPAKIVRERIVNLGLASRNLSRKAVLRAWAMRRPYMRWRARRRRVREKWVALGAEVCLDQEIERLADTGGPIVVGPWVSEVGFETLYWVPFVRWFRATYRVKPDQLLVLTRGGAGAWYADITPNRAEIFDYVTPDAFAAYNNARAESPGGTIKQLGISPFEQNLVDRASADWGVSSPTVLHPSLMYRLFQQFWAGNRSLAFLDEHTQYSLVSAPDAPELPELPAEYVAVKFYSAQSLQDTPETRRVLRQLLGAISDRYPIVLLDTGLALDDHGEYDCQTTRRVVSARAWMTPRDNLAAQTRIIAGARAFVGTCGSIAWLAPMLGVDTTAVMTDVKFLNVHLHVARRVYRVLGGGRFTPFDLGALAPLGLGLVADRSTELA